MLRYAHLLLLLGCVTCGESPAAMTAGASLQRDALNVVSAEIPLDVSMARLIDRYVSDRLLYSMPMRWSSWRPRLRHLPRGGVHAVALPLSSPYDAAWGTLSACILARRGSAGWDPNLAQHYYVVRRFSDAAGVRHQHFSEFHGHAAQKPSFGLLIALQQKALRWYTPDPTSACCSVRGIGKGR